MGNLSASWLDEFGKAAVGQLNTIEADKKRKLDKEDAQFDFKIVFPTLATVQASTVGPNAFGTLFCKQKDFLSPNFPRDCFYDCHSRATGRTQKAMHSKIMTVSSAKDSSKSTKSSSKSAKGSSKDDPIELESSEDEAEETQSSRKHEEQKELYRYIGSHNFTAAAWGRLCKGGSALLVNNYEMGMLIPADFSSEFPYTYHRPPRKYSPDDLPWDQMTYFSH